MRPPDVFVRVHVLALAEGEVAHLGGETRLEIRVNLLDPRLYGFVCFSSGNVHPFLCFT